MSLSSGNNKRITAVIIVLLIAIIGGGIYIATRDAKNETVSSNDTIEYSTDEPDESKANADSFQWSGASDEPKKIRIKKTGVDAYIQKVGVDQNQLVAVPTNIHLTGWFVDSQKPGEKGLSIIDGHVTGRTGDGVFINLGRLTVGDEFEIELGNGQIKRYSVIEKVQVKEKESAAYLFSQNPEVESQVNLITCGGDFDNASDTYEDRIIVSGRLL